MIAEMGINAPEPKKVYDARRKIRTAGLAVMATVRMQRMSQEWTKVKKIGESLRRAKNELAMKRDGQRRREGSLSLREISSS